MLRRALSAIAAALGLLSPARAHADPGEAPPYTAAFDKAFVPAFVVTTRDTYKGETRVETVPFRIVDAGALLVPSNAAWALWGWPNRFLLRMRAAGTDVYLLSPTAGGGFSSGVDTTLDVGQLPEGYDGGIWTNRVQAIAPLLVPK